MASDEDKPGSSIPSEVEPGQSNAEEKKPDQNQPDENKPEENKPDDNKPDVSRPDVSQPDLSQPDVSRPEVSQPDDNKPDTSPPEANKPEPGQPDEKKPDENQPNENEPNASQPTTIQTNASSPSASQTNASQSRVSPPTTSRANAGHPHASQSRENRPYANTHPHTVRLEERLRGPGPSCARHVFRLTIVRHGQTNHNKMHLLQGQLDVRLNKLGREQAGLLSRYFQRLNIRFDQVYSSDLSRAQETARIICAAFVHERPISIHLNSLLRERSYGTLQGLPINVIRELAKLACCKPPPHVVPDCSWGPQSKIYRPDGGELIQEVRTRLNAFCEHWLLPNARNQQNILIVSHGGTIRELMRIFKYKYGAALRVQDMTMTPNTGVSEFDIWLDDKHRIAHITPNQLHKLPHLTFDVFNRYNPNVNLNNLHMRKAAQNRLAATVNKQDLNKEQQDQSASEPDEFEPTLPTPTPTRLAVPLTSTSSSSSPGDKRSSLKTGRATLNRQLKVQQHKSQPQPQPQPLPQQQPQEHQQPPEVNGKEKQEDNKENEKDNEKEMEKEAADKAGLNECKENVTDSPVATTSQAADT